MQRFTLFMIVAVTTFPYLASGDFWGQGKFLPGVAAYVPELLSAIAVAVVIVLGARDHFRNVRAAYWIAFGTLLISVICGVVVNDVGTGPIFAGLRLYIRGIPWFFVPAMVAFTDAQVRRQLLLIMGICLLQVPIAIQQRILTGRRDFGFTVVTGDWTTGTIGDSGVLSVFLVAAACVMAALYEKRQLSFWQFIGIFLLILVPTTINETKATIIFLPIGLLLAILFAARPGERLKKLLIGCGVLLVFGAIFVPVYDALNADRQYSTKLSEFFLNRENLEDYIGAGTAGSEQAPGRVEAITVPLKNLAQDPAQLVFGYGIGNASASSWGTSFSGSYASQYKIYLQGALSRFVLELGVLGVLVLFIIYWLIFQDCLKVVRGGDSLMSGLAAGWVGVIAVVTIGLVYALVETYAAVTFLFWYFSGLIAAQRMRLRNV